jgi:AcrR family transcriptional regulator
MNDISPIKTKTAKSWSRRKSARPGEIIDAALKVFAEKGYAATRMEDIAQVAGVTKGTIYLYFPGKEEVFKTLAREVVGSTLSGFDKRMQAFAGNARDQLVMLLNAIAEFLQDEDRAALPKIIISESGNFPELARFWRSEVIDKALTMITATLKHGIARGEFRAVELEYAARLCVSPIMLGVIWRATFAPLASEPFDFKQLFSAHVDMLLHGLEHAPESGNPVSSHEHDRQNTPEGNAP